MAGALCIVLAMMLGAVAGFVYARDAGIVGVSPDVGTRGEDRRLVSAFDELQQQLSMEEAAVADEPSGPVSLLGSNAIEIVSPDGGLVARPVTAEEQREAMRHVSVSDRGTIAVEPARPETRYSGAGIDAGGPYGGPDVFEGTALTISVTPLDPTIIFFRYDFNGDGVFDYPDQTGGGTIGFWTTESTITRRFNDDLFGDMVVQGWDGISVNIQLNSGDNLGQPTGFQWFLGMFGSTYRTMGWQFRAKADITVTELGHYHYAYTLYNMQIHRVNGAVLLGTCTPVHVTFSWNWCTLPTPADLVQGEEYRVSIRVENYMTGLNTPSDTDKVQFQGTYYCFSTTDPTCMPNSFWSSSFIPQLDFRWRETLIIPDAAQDTARIEVNNVAPTVFGVTTDPSPGLEGSPTNFVAEFTDPGLDDTWEYRWIFHDGEVSSWRPVSKFSGGARVLILHSWTGDVGGFKSAIVATCGNYCVSVDDFDFGPLGQNRIPTLDELRPYNVLLVGTNWGPIPNSNAVGDRLAEYMDATGGGVVMMFAGFDTSSTWGIGGRWQSENYAPIDRVGFIFSTSSLGTIYVPGHPILDGVSTFSSYYRHNQLSVKSGAVRVADFADGRVAIATKVSPAGNGALACALPWFPLSSGGDYWRVIVNALRYCSQQPDPVLKTMPITLDALAKTYRDDEPTTTTPEDSFPVRVEVRDDDHGKVKIVSQQQLLFNDFNSVSECSGFWGSPSTWPPGWWADPDGMGWVCSSNSYGQGRSPYILYYFNDPLYGTGDGNSYLYTPAFDLSGYTGIQFDFYTYWQADWPSGNQNGYIQASLDGGATWPISLYELHHNNPASLRGDVSFQNLDVGGASDVVFRFYYQSSDDWWWAVDNVRIKGLVGSVIEGLGSAEGVATVANVPPTVIGGFDSALRNEAQALTFQGFEIADPAILEPTEWFAYRWDFDDGTASEWNYVGSLAPPKFDILVVHTMCLGGITSTCADLNGLTNLLRAADDVGTVDTFNFINYPFLPTAPSVSTMLQYDVIIVATNWAYISYQPFDLARRQVGDNLAAYLEAGRGGVLTMMAVYDLSDFYGDIFTINGRYIDYDYGPFEKTNYIFTPQSTLGTRYQPDHDIFVKVGNNVGSQFISPGDMPTTVGGSGLAAGRNGQLLADWPNGNSAIGVKELTNGMRTAHFGAFANPTGSDTGMLLRNMVGWVGGGIPSPKVPTFQYAWGDNGIYTIDLQVIDDDMGYVWDFADNEPTAALPDAQVAHRYITVAVDNTDPVIVPNSIEAFIAAQVCVRISGTGGNSVTADLYADGLLSTTTTVTRQSGSPNPTDEKCGLMRVDVTAPHTFSATLTYNAPMGGSNPTWLVIAPWRDPISPGHGTVTYKYDFGGTAGTVTQPLPTLKTDLLAGGRGAKIDFVAEAWDAGTDDLAFLWVFGNTMLSPYAVNCPTCTYAIHVLHNDGSPRTEGTLEGPQFLGFGEPFFDRAANTGRSPLGTTNLRVRDSAVHAFDASQLVYYVVLIVLDDDNTRGYPSTFAPNDGVDMQFVVVDLR